VPYPTEPLIWPPHTVSIDPSHLQSSTDQETPHTSLNSLKTAEPASKQFFCTFCSELGTWKTIKTKQDWKRHEEDYHNGTGLQWICRDCKEVRQIPRIYACGFENCRTRSTTWKHRCDHVAGHMDQGDTNWTYNRTIRVLLKHEYVSAHWKHIYTVMCPQYGIIHTYLTWDIRSTHTMRDQLQNHSFVGRLEDFLLELFHRGLPAAKTHTLINHMLPYQQASPSVYAAPPSIPPIIPALVGFDFDPSFGDDSFCQNETGSTNNGIVASALSHRNSVLMTDAPHLHGPSTFNTSSHDPFREVPPMANELISLGNFITETNSDYDDYSSGTQEHTSTQDSTKSHSPRALVNKSREWLASKKSQHFQHVVIDHPDVSPNLRLPSSSSRKRSTTAVHRTRNEQS
jgi:hypothetical protein